jgi:hypothetical protein
MMACLVQAAKTLIPQCAIEAKAAKDCPEKLERASEALETVRTTLLLPRRTVCWWVRKARPGPRLTREQTRPAGERHPHPRR